MESKPGKCENMEREGKCFVKKKVGGTWVAELAKSPT